MCFGGEENPLRVETEVTTGDAVAIPAGVDPACWRTWKGGFEMVGNYPKDCSKERRRLRGLWNKRRKGYDAVRP